MLIWLMYLFSTILAMKKTHWLQKSTTTSTCGVVIAIDDGLQSPWHRLQQVLFAIMSHHQNTFDVLMQFFAKLA
jgi:hypothetical protein